MSVGVLPAIEPETADGLELPKLTPGQSLDVSALRDSWATLYRVFVWSPAATLGAVLVLLLLNGSLGVPELLVIATFVVGIWLLALLSWKLLLAFIVGNTVEVNPSQYPQLHDLVRDASTLLDIKQPPRVLIMQGHGLVELLVAKWFARRGILLLTSNLIDELTKYGSSRQLMFLVGRQLGLMRTGFFRFWFIQHFLGRFSFAFYAAWQRRCHLTADKFGLLVAGDLYASEQALLTITVGASLAPGANMDAIEQQKLSLFDTPWSWIRLCFAEYPYMVDRLVRLRTFAREASARGIQANAKAAVGIIPLVHRPIRVIPVMIIHGHDAAGRLELENLLLKRFPHISPVAMIAVADAARTLPEKFETLARQVKGAIALLTPDDRVTTLSSGIPGDRARQNVVIEIGWFWGKIGRGRCLLLKKGALDLPSDLSGVEVHSFHDSPIECSEVLRDFVESLEMAV